MSKYKNKKACVGGIEFDSRKEAKRYIVLKDMEKRGLITDLQLQVKFTLIPAQREPDKVGVRGGKIKGKLIERECAYVADFVYKVPITMEKLYSTTSGKIGSMEVHCGYETVVEDTKGFRTADYKIKRKLMLHVHGIKIKEV